MAAAYAPQQTEAMQFALVAIKHFNRTARVIDRDNILSSLKAAFDGLTDAGVWSDDRDAVFLPVSRLKDAANPRVELKIIPSNAEQIEAAIKNITNAGS